MKRAALSVLCGVTFPFCYAIVTGPLSTFVEDSRIQFLLNIPIAWPRLLYFYFAVPFIGDSLVVNETAFLLYIIGCDVFLYTLLTYCTSLAFPFTRVAIKEDSPPPPDVL